MEISTLRLEWRVYERVRIYKKSPKKSEESYKYIRTRNPEEDLLNFLVHESGKDKFVRLRYMIDAFDFADYANMYLYKGKILDSYYQCTLSFLWNQAGYELREGESLIDKVDFGLLAMHLKSHLGQLITLTDVLNLNSVKSYNLKSKMIYESDSSKEKFINWILKEETTEPVNLYCCRICGDRECGYFPLDITIEGDYIRWKFLDYHKGFIFNKTQYEAAFDEYKQLIEAQLTV